jgi:hypothetical protein
MWGMRTSDVRPLRAGAYEWTDRDDDVVGGLEPFPGHPSIVATLSLVTNERAVGGVRSTGIHITRQDAEEIIAWLRGQLASQPD